MNTKDTFLGDYHIAQKIIHWLMALFVMLDLFIAQKLGGEMEGWDRLESRIDHGTSGTVITVLFLLRIIARWKFGAPPLPASMPAYQIKLAHWGHGAMYFLLASLIVTGILTGIHTTDPIMFYNAIEISIGNTSEDHFQFVRRFHELTTQALIGLIVIHVSASLYHHFIHKDEGLVRMLKFWRRYSSQQ